MCIPPVVLGDGILRVSPWAMKSKLTKAMLCFLLLEVVVHCNKHSRIMTYVCSSTRNSFTLYQLRIVQMFNAIHLIVLLEVGLGLACFLFTEVEVVSGLLTSQPAFQVGACSVHGKRT